MTQTTADLDRFWSYVDRTGECWLWTGWARESRNAPYGIFSFAGRDRRAHRWIYEQLVGPIPDGMQIDHLCRRTLCVRPEHLEPVSGHENILRGTSPVAVNAAKTHCVHGHPLSGSNLRMALSRGLPTRRCRECERERGLRRKAMRDGG